MKEIIDRLFLENSYSKVPFENSDIYIIDFWKYTKKEAYYLVLYANMEQLSENFLKDEVPKLFNNLKKNLDSYTISMDKNLTLLICLKGNNTDDEKENSLILDIEEDPYFFKKNVIRYTENDKKMFTNNFSSSVTKQVNETVNNIQLFEKFKKEGDAFYELCTKLMIKLPFLVYENKKRDIDNLKSSIEKEVEDKKILNLYKFINDDNFKLTDSKLAIAKLKEYYNEQ